MDSALQERVSQILVRIKPSSEQPVAQEAEEVRQLLALAIREAARQQQSELQKTLRLCLVAFQEALKLENAPGHFRAVVRACKALCLEGLAQSGRETNSA